jgi:hypothetical protein
VVLKATISQFSSPENYKIRVSNSEAENNINIGYNF